MNREIKKSIKSLLIQIGIALLAFGIIFCALRCNNTSFEKRLKKLGLTPTEVKYIYEDRDGNIWHCVPASGYRQEVIERM